MSKEPLIQIKNLSKIYKYGTINYSTLVDDFSEFISNRIKKNKIYMNVDKDNNLFFSETKKKKYFYALNKVNLEVKRGEAVAIIGKNGSGKTTLVKCISRICYPTSGEIVLYGKVAPIFLNISSIINPELTGKENIYLMTKEEIEEKIDNIISFSELEKFVDTPVKRYSTGMNSRLAFSIIVHLNVDIFLADEILSVGDQEFKEKCIFKLNDLILNHGKSLILISHEREVVKSICSRAYVLENGICTEKNNIKEAFDYYEKI